MRKINKEKIKEYFEEVKKEAKKEYSKEVIDAAKNDLKNDIKSIKDLDEKNAGEFKEELDEEKKSMAITLGATILVLIILATIIVILYFSFHERIEKRLDAFIDTIPVYNSQDPNKTGDNNSTPTENPNNNDNNSNNNQQNKGCTQAFDGTYLLGAESITFMTDGYYDKSLNDITTATGFYTNNNGTITVDVTYEDYTLGSAKITYSITKDCKKITETSTGKVFTRK